MPPGAHAGRTTNGSSHLQIGSRSGKRLVRAGARLFFSVAEIRTSAFQPDRWHADGRYRPAEALAEKGEIQKSVGTWRNSEARPLIGPSTLRLGEGREPVQLPGLPSGGEVKIEARSVEPSVSGREKRITRVAG